MGYRCRWVAARLDVATMLRRLGLDVVREHHEAVHDTGLWAVSLPQGWTVVMGDGWDAMDLVSADDARELSADAEALAFYTDDTPMAAAVAEYRRGAVAWSLDYDADTRALAVRGAAPDVVRETIAACEAEQDVAGEDGPDLRYDAAPRIAQAWVGFRHDETLASGAHLPILELSRALVVAAPSSPVAPTNVAPIRAEVRAALRTSGQAICTSILDVAQWPSFRGWGPLPGIRAARFRQRTDTVVGSVIEVQNDDGSSHVERITRWEPGVAVTFHIEELSRPLSALATHLVETWTFAPTSDGDTASVRTMALYPRGRLGRLLLHLVAPMLRRALARHLRQLDAAAAPRP